MLPLEETVCRETDMCVCVADMLVSLRYVQIHTRSSHSPEERHPSAKVQAAACKALGNLACNDANEVRIAAEGGINAVVTAMQGHSTNAKLGIEHAREHAASRAFGQSKSGLRARNPKS